MQSHVLWIQDIVKFENNLLQMKFQPKENDIEGNKPQAQKSVQHFSESRLKISGL